MVSQQNHVFWTGSDWFIDIFMCLFAGFLAIETICGIFLILHWNIEIPRKPRYTLCFSNCKLVVVVGSKGLSYTNMFKQFHFVGFKRFLRKIVETNKNKKNGMKKCM